MNFSAPTPRTSALSCKAACTIRSCARCSSFGLADVYGETSVPIYCLNVTYPLIDDEVAGFALNKKAILIVEEGQPEFIEQAVNTILRRRDIQTKISGKDVLPMAGEYTPQVVTKGVKSFLELHGKSLLGNSPPPPDASSVLADPKVKELAKSLPPRPPSFCVGCPERPIFAAMKLVQQELGPHQIAGDIGCHLFASLPPFNVGATTMGYGLGPASSSAFNVKAGKKPISVIGDGGFWHNGLSTSIANAVYNKQNGVIMVVDNFYSAATGGQDIPSSRALNPARATNNTIVDAVIQPWSLVAEGRPSLFSSGNGWVFQAYRVCGKSHLGDTD